MSVAVSIGRKIVHRLAVGQADIEGNDFAGIFGAAIDGSHRESPLGVADVEWNKCAWSVKTVKDKRPLAQQRIRVIAGRNSPIYSMGISDPFANVEATGRAVLSIWNARVNEALTAYDDLRILVFVRNLDSLEFTVFEHEAHRFVWSDYQWSVNKNQNLEARDQLGNHCFSWQPHGSQFTVIHRVPPSALRFRINKRPGMVAQSTILEAVGFDESWVVRV